jgi:hypothetical protein
MAWISTNWGLIVSVLFGVSEALALIPGIKSNSVFTLIYNGLKFLMGGGKPQIPPGA